MKKNQTKKNNKNFVYVILMVSIAISSVLSIFSMKKNVTTSIDEENVQKIFSANSETIDNKKEKSEEDKKFVEKISFIKQDEKEIEKIEKKDDQNEVEKINQKEESTNQGEISNEIKTENKKEEIVENQKEISNQKQQEKNNQSKKEETDKKEDLKEEQEEFDYDKKEVFFRSKDSFIVPVVGEIERDFSDDKLIYSKTLDEWRVHKGVDIIAKEGTLVKAVLDGYVEEIKDDHEYGMSVSIRHSKNLVSVYKSLACDVLVLPNQIIKQGDTIGFVSNTAKVENSIGAHLHFEMIKKDKLVDPKIYIQFKKK